MRLAIVFSVEGMPLRPRPDIWLALLVPVMPTLLKPRPSPSPKLEEGADPGEGRAWGRAAAKLGVLGIGMAAETGRSGWLGGLGVLLEGTEGFVCDGCCCCCWFADCACCCAA